MGSSAADRGGAEGDGAESGLSLALVTATAASASADAAHAAGGELLLSAPDASLEVRPFLPARLPSPAAFAALPPRISFFLSVLLLTPSSTGTDRKFLGNQIPSVSA